MFFKSVLYLLSIYLLTQGNSDFRIDYTYIEETGAFYKFNTLPRARKNAEIACEREGTVLFYPEDETEALAVTEYWKKIQPNIHWIAVNMTRNNFKTPEGTLKTGDYSIWNTGEPNNAGGNEDCIVLSDNATLNDVNCHYPYPFICKKPDNAIAWSKDCHIPYPGYTLDKAQDRCYKFHSTPKNWTDAFSICYGEQSYLAVVNNEKEATYLVNLITTNTRNGAFTLNTAERIHLGFLNKNGWITIHGDPLHVSGYNKWDQSQPDGGINEDCGAMSSDGLLHDVSCSEEMAFICEHEMI